MDMQFRNKLIEIGFDKGLIGLLIVLAGFQVNSSLERYKLIEAQRVTDTSEFVKACSDLWANVYDYEDGINDADQLKAHRWFIKMFEKKTDAEIEAKIAEREKKNEEKLAAFNKVLTERRYIIGEPMVRHFWQYIGFLRFRADAQESSRNEVSPSTRENSSKVVAEMNEKLSTMRFSANAAREHAVSKLP